MKSKLKDNGNILIKDDYEKFPTEIKLSSIYEVADSINKAMNYFVEGAKLIYDCSENKHEAFNIFKNELCSINLYNFSEYNIDKYKYDIDRVNELVKELETNNDDVDEIEDLWDLTDEGYSKCFGYDNSTLQYELIIKDDDEAEFAEEIFIIFNKDKRKKPEIKHRMRKVWWKKVKGGKSSTKIEYEPMEISEKLKKIINNTINQEKKIKR